MEILWKIKVTAAQLSEALPTVDKIVLDSTEGARDSEGNLKAIIGLASLAEQSQYS